ncbi:hypothetical protein GEMRC1_001313 [Eukaryota sp. GEM-RC1]
MIPDINELIQKVVTSMNDQENDGVYDPYNIDFDQLPTFIGVDNNLRREYENNHIHRTIISEVYEEDTSINEILLSKRTNQLIEPENHDSTPEFLEYCGDYVAVNVSEYESLKRRARLYDHIVEPNLKRFRNEEDEEEDEEDVY